MSDELSPEAIEQLREISEKLASFRTPSKAHLIGAGRTPEDEEAAAEESARRQLEKLGVANQLGAQPGFFHAVWQAKSRDAQTQQIGKAKLAELGSKWVDVPDYAKATLGDTAAAGGNIVPNNLVASFIEQAAIGERGST